jgi:hypothetical protein
MFFCDQAGVVRYFLKLKIQSVTGCFMFIIMSHYYLIMRVLACNMVYMSVSGSLYGKANQIVVVTKESVLGDSCNSY